MRDDLVRRSDVMESLTAEYNRKYKEGCGLQLAYIEKAVNEAPSPWISAEDRLPDMGDMVKIMAVAKSAGDGVLVDSVFITHWMPLPEPPEEGGTSE